MNSSLRTTEMDSSSTSADSTKFSGSPPSHELRRSPDENMELPPMESASITTRSTKSSRRLLVFDVEQRSFGDARSWNGLDETECSNQDPSKLLQPDDLTSWREVYEACCIHTTVEWLSIACAVMAIIFFFYWFLFGLELLGSGAKVMSGCGAGKLFGEQTNPVAGVMVGILATTMLQSSSTTTSIIVSLVGDNQGSGTISVDQGIYMIMGANIGTSVTNTIVACGHVGNADQLDRAFAGATVHDLFNFMTVAVMLPTELITGMLKHLTEALTKNASTDSEDSSWEGPIKKLVSPLASRIIIENKKVAKAIASGESACGDFYPMTCDEQVDPPTYESCDGKFGLIACDEDTNFCPGFFSKDASEHDDKVSGGVIFFIALFMLFSCLMAMVAILQTMLLGVSTRIIFKATNVNGYVSILIGAAITCLVQSSSITTSTLTPLVGIGAIRLEQMYPLTLGANIGTTITGLTASLVSENIESLQVALAHLFFNIFGICLFYPIPFMRALPLNASRRLGGVARIWRGFPVLYIVAMFLLMPLVILGITVLFDQAEKGFTVLASILVILLSLVMLYLVFWCCYGDGQEACANCMRRREREQQVLDHLPDDMEYVLAKIHRLIEHTDLPEDDEDFELDEGSSWTGTEG